MNRRQTYYKALFLLLVFSMNTGVSFACSFSSMFHALHHHEKGPVHQLSGETGHHHNKADVHRHHHGSNHSSDDQATKSGEEDSKEDCCSASIIKMEGEVKLANKSVNAPDPIVLVSFFSAYTSLFSLFPPSESLTHDDSFRWRTPATIVDLRIVIQSFQI